MQVGGGMDNLGLLFFMLFRFCCWIDSWTSSMFPLSALTRKGKLWGIRPACMASLTWRTWWGVDYLLYVLCNLCCWWQDSLVDLAIALGLPHEQVIVGVPAHGILYKLSNMSQTTPGSPAIPWNYNEAIISHSKVSVKSYPKASK